jgi:hypothetical protein
MGRPPDKGIARRDPIQIRLTTGEKEVLDLKRGVLTRSEYVRRLIERDPKPDA